MDDRELLELAAKAADVPGAYNEEYRAFWIAESIRGDEDAAIFARGRLGLSTQNRTWWSPLHDDGDALRLAVKLGFRVYVYAGGGDSSADTTVVAGDELANRTPWAQEPHRGDRYAATRRAIVRAAAELGSTLASQ